MSTFAYQENLPKLPVPKLEDTCQHYLETLSVIQTVEEHEQTKKQVDTFLKDEGPKLQEKLIKYAESRSSYIEDFWFESYLTSPGSVVLNLNPFFVLEDDPTPSRNNQFNRAASLTLSSIKFVCALRNRSLEPDLWRKTPLCMSQFHYLFGSSRTPTLIKDQVKTISNSKHIVVLCRNQFYWFDCVWENGTMAITEKELLNNFHIIKEDAAKLSDAEAAINAVGVLTSDERGNWAILRQSLQDSNHDTLKVVDTALFVVCLDNTAPNSPSEFAATALHGTYNIDKGSQTGTCINRWYDKLQIIVCENGVAGVNFEHSAVDGHTVLRFVSDVYTDTIIRFAQSIRGRTQSLFNIQYLPPSGSSDPNRPNLTPHKLEWNLSASLLKGIRFAEAKISDLILQNEVKVLEFTNYGKSFIVQHNLSPDAFVQISFMTAYFSQYGTQPNTYEPVLTKKFLHGRTEAARSMTKEALKFMQLFCSDDVNVTPLSKTAALRVAIAAQVSMVKRCANGHGVDRHLFALKCIFSQEASKSSSTLPAIFSDRGWSKLNETVLSTSNCGNPSLRLFGFGPVIPEGFGIGYIIKDESIQFCASSKHRQTQRYLQTLQAYLLSVESLLRAERANTYPNLSTELEESGNRASSPNHLPVDKDCQRRPSISGYGFFDCGSVDSPVAKQEPCFPRVGRSL